jgi:hypothetical protein
MTPSFPACPKCQEPMKRIPSLLGESYFCEQCDGEYDPIETGRGWTEGELKPPSPSSD